MPKLRMNKHIIKNILESNDWLDNIPLIADRGKSSIGPLFSFLLLKPEIMHRAAKALGATVAKMANEDLESAKIVIRRFMWHMNEESGNIGWGIPDAFSECLVACPALVPTYAKILLSYIIDLCFDDNYCDNDILRRSCFWAIGNFAISYPDLAQKDHSWLIKGLDDRDSICRGMAAWALGKLSPDMMDAPALKKLVDENNNDICEIFENNHMRKDTVSHLAYETLNRDKEKKLISTWQK